MTMRVRIHVVALISILFVPALSAMAEDKHGAELYVRYCRSCHQIADGDRVIQIGGRHGPNLFGFFGRPAAGVDGFVYSDSMRAASAAGLVWDETQTIEFVLGPWQYLRDYLNDENARSNMPNRIKDRKVIEEIIAYLRSVQTE